MLPHFSADQCLSALCIVGFFAWLIAGALSKRQGP